MDKSVVAIILVSTVDVSGLQQQVESLAQEYRLLDTQIQSLSWQVDVLEV